MLISFNKKHNIKKTDMRKNPDICKSTKNFNCKVIKVKTSQSISFNDYKDILF